MAVLDMRALNSEQRRDFAVVMSVYDLYLRRKYGEDIIDQNGALISEAYAEREAVRESLYDEVSKGANLLDTFPRDLPRPALRGRIAAPIQSLPDFGNDEDNQKANQLLIAACKESTRNSLPLPLYNSIPQSKTFTPPHDRYTYARHLGTSYGDGDLSDLSIFSWDVGDMKLYSVKGNTDREFETSLSTAKRQGFEPYMATKVVCAVNDYRKSKGEMPLGITDAQRLREEIRYGASSLSMSGGYEQMLSKLDAETAEHIRETLPLMNVYDEFDRLDKAGLEIVDVFGQNGTDIVVSDVRTGTKRAVVHQIADYGSVHPFLTRNRGTQKELRGLDADEPAPHDLWGIGSADLLVKDKSFNAMYHYQNGAIKSPSKDADIVLEDLQLDNPNHRENFSVGSYRSMEDMLGVSSFRRYMKTAEWDRLDLRIPDAFKAKFAGKTDAEIMEDPLVRNNLRAMQNAQRILQYMDANNIAYEVTEDMNNNDSYGNLQLCAKLPDYNNMSVRLLDLNNPMFVGRVYGDGMETRLTIGQQDVPVINADLFRSYAGNDHWMVSEEANGRQVVRYMPDEEQALAALKYRLGEEVESPNANFDAPVGHAGSETIHVGAGGATRVIPAAQSAVVHKVLYDEARVAMVNRSTGRFDMRPNGPAMSTRQIYIQTKRDDVELLEDLTPTEAHERLRELIETARLNVQDEVFGDLMTEVKKKIPEYQKTSWIAYRRDLNSEDGYAHDENGDLIEIGRRTRNPRLLEGAGEAAEGQNIESILENLSDDPAIRVLQESYVNMVLHEDMIMRGVIDGQVVEESAAEYQSRMQAQRDLVEYEETESEAVQKLLDAMNLNVPELDGRDLQEAREARLGVVIDHFNEHAKLMFGEVGSKPDDTMKINIGSLQKYAGVEDAELRRLVMMAQKEYNIEFVHQSDEFTMNRAKMMTLDFDPSTAQPFMNRHTMSPFMVRMSETIQRTLEQSGCEIEDMQIDENGVVQYKAKQMISSQVSENGKNTTKFDESRFTGTIGQIFDPDDRGVILTKFNHDDNYAMIPGHLATVIPGSGSYTSRTRLKGYEEAMESRLQYEVRSQILALQKGGIVDPLDATALNTVYRHLNDSRLPLDYMQELRSRGGDEEFAERWIQTGLDLVRYPTSYGNESTINAVKRAKESNFVDDTNRNAFSLLKDDISILEHRDVGVFDRCATATGTTQGLSAVLTEGARKGEDGRPIPSEDINDRCSLMKHPAFSKTQHNPFDRQQMVYSNARQALKITDKAVTAHVTLQGWNMEDGNVVSKAFADRYLVRIKSDVPGFRNLIEAIPDSVIEDKVIDENHQISVYTEEDGLTYCQFEGERYRVQPNSDGVYENVAGQIKQQMIERGVGYRPLIKGDKICDAHGNKGVINLIVDPDMDEATAARLGLEKPVALFRANPDLEVVSAPFSVISRFNCGTAREMMENTSDLQLPDGTVLEGVKGELVQIITDKTAEAKTHVYGEEAALENKGRRISSQLAWNLQGLHADALMERFYGDNAANWRNIREKLLVCGMDFNEQYELETLKDGFHPHNIGTEAAPVYEERPLIGIDVSSAVYSDVTITPKGKVSCTVKEGRKDAQKAVVDQLSATGGMMELPFPLMMASGVQTPEQLDENGEKTGKYLLPVLPIEYRTDQTYDDGTSGVHNYTRNYRTIAHNAVNYQLNQGRIDRIQEYMNGLDESDVAGRANAQAAIDAIKRDQNRFQANATKAYYRMTEDVKRISFEGKENAWKSQGMAKKITSSATEIWSADPRLKLDEVMISQEQANLLNLAEGDPILMWRDPQLHTCNIASMRVKIADPAEGVLTGIAVHPAIAKRYDGDFDGDTIGFVSVFNMKPQDRALMKGYLDIHESTPEATRKAHEKYARDHGMTVGRLEKFVSRNHATYEMDMKCASELEEKLSIVATLEDKGKTALNPKTVDDVEILVNTGLDIASGKVVLEAEGNTIYSDKSAEAKQHLLYALNPELGWEEKGRAWFEAENVSRGEHEKLSEKHAKELFIKNERQAALDCTQEALDAAMDKAFVSDYMQYGGHDASSEEKLKAFCDSVNRMVNDHKTKGSDKAFDSIAAYMGMGVEFTTKENPYGETCRYFDTDKSIKDYGQPAICMGLETDPELKQMYEKMRERYADVEEATAIKAYATGIAGTVSQRMVKVMREFELASGLETTYVATQGVLQTKHNPEEARQKYDVLMDVMPAVWHGNRICENSDGKLVPMRDAEGKPVKAQSPEEWAKDYMLMLGPKGMGCDLHESHVHLMAQRLFPGGKNEDGSPVFKDVYDTEMGATLDRLAYGATFDILLECAEQKRNIFDTGATQQFKPSESVAREHMKTKNAPEVVKEMVESYSPTMEEAAREAKREAESAKYRQTIEQTTENGKKIEASQTETVCGIDFK